MRRSVLLLLMMTVLLAAPALQAQEFDFNVPPAPEHASTAAAMQDLAQRILPVFQDKDPERYLAHLGALQLVAGNAEAAQLTRQSLRDRRNADAARHAEPRVLFHDLYAHARQLEASGVAFAEAYRQAFRDRVPALDDRAAQALMRMLDAPPALAHEALQARLQALAPQPRLELAQALDLVWNYLAYQAYQRFAPLVGALEQEQRERRYALEQDLRITARGGVELRARVVRPRGPVTRLPALLQLGIDDVGLDDAYASASHGYVGVIVQLPLGGPAGVLPFRRDAELARAVIDWIVQQGWSDGRVGMYGTRYAGFTAWAAARQAPAALQAIVSVDAMAPGIDFPREGGVFFNSALRWIEARTQPPRQDAATRDDAFWQGVDRRWFDSGRAYRDLERVAGAPNRAFGLWLGHPSYDRWWQRMIPFGEQFAKVEVPVLSILRSTRRREAGTLYYFGQHLRHRAQANHLLLAGVRDRRPLAGDGADLPAASTADVPVALDLQTLRLAYFDHVLRKAPRPAVLKERVNLALSGRGPGWRYADSLQALSTPALRLHLDAAPAAAGERRLLRTPAAGAAPVEQLVALERKRAAAPATLRYVSEPFAESMELAGLMSGALDLRPSRMDLDLVITLSERHADGRQREIAAPYVFRASYAGDRTRRRLLQAGVRQRLPFQVERLLAHRLDAGSRLVLDIGVNLRPDQQVNHGLGGDVSAESARAARRPLKIRWYEGSHIDLPLHPRSPETP